MIESTAQPAQGVWKERLVYALLFLFPLAGVSVRHWFSGIFTALVLIALWDLVRRVDRAPVLREQRVWMWLCAGFFLSFLISALWNGWAEPQDRALAVAVRYLAIVPVVMMLRQYSRAGEFLLLGGLVSALLLASQSYHDVYELQKYRAEGVYSPNLLGPVAAIVVLFALCSWRRLPRTRWLLPAVIALALWAVALSGSRGAYLGLIVAALVWALTAYRGWWRGLAAAIVLTVPVVLYSSLEMVSERVDIAVAQVADYFQSGGHVREQTNVQSSAIRFEMWRAGWRVFKEAPVFGVGTGNYARTVSRFVAEGSVHPEAANAGHPHNAFVDVLMSRGLVGFVVFAGMLLYPMYFFFNTRRASPDTAALGMAIIAGFATFSLTDASPFDKNNFASIFLLYVAVILSWHAALVRRTPP